jgi:hypothetical protein
MWIFSDFSAQLSNCQLKKNTLYHGVDSIYKRCCRVFEETLGARKNHTECVWEVHIVHWSTYLIGQTFNSSATNRISNRIWWGNILKAVAYSQDAKGQEGKHWRLETDYTSSRQSKLNISESYFCVYIIGMEGYGQLDKMPVGPTKFCNKCTNYAVFTLICH